ncbi:Uncharacterised protein [Kluyvera cryocrescens]|uniref:Uncharacterized protein n=1 Tax=Kluyvera cryocrescens TaxID=580 RepID=A0A485A4S7_KLUCR|nr:Uncharacterised protein [Kluyvera cryocrescens]
MERRHFLKSAAALSTLGLVSPTFAKTEAVAQPAATSSGKYRRFVMTQTYSLKAPEGSSGKVNLWIPIPEDTAFQQLLNLSFNGNYQSAALNANNRYGAKVLFVTWPASSGPLEIKVEMEIETRDWEVLKDNHLADWQLPVEGGVIPDEIKAVPARDAAHPRGWPGQETALKNYWQRESAVKTGAFDS